MDRPNLYLSYKKDTSRLLFWIIDTSNSIVRREADPGKCAPVTINTSGQCTVAGMVEMAQLIAIYHHPVPTTILKLLRAIIRARTAIYKSYQQILTMQPDPVIEKSNASHKHFIDALQQAFDALGGLGLLSDAGNQADKTPTHSEIDETLFCNRFSALGRQENKHDAVKADSEKSHDEDGQSEATKKRQKRNKKKKGKKGMGGKGSKHNLKSMTTPDGGALPDVPIDNYRFIEDEGDLGSDYRLAIHSVIAEWRELRATTQNLWYEVAYEGLNAAIATSLSHMAVAMVQQTCIAVFRDFPGHESYDTIVNTITRGDGDKAAIESSTSLPRLLNTGIHVNIEHENVDINEQLWIYTYNDLLDFLTDYRQSRRRGKPTKNMQKQIEGWDPRFDLTRATNQDRVRWRRAYTIKWLYDLVNVFSSLYSQPNTAEKSRNCRKGVFWSDTAPAKKHRRILDLNGFAAFISTLAMQKPGSNVRARILPHHVFQLQSAVESFTIARGWMIHPYRGHITFQPPPRSNPRRDLDRFLGCLAKPPSAGIIEDTDFLRYLLQKDFDAQHLAEGTYAHFETALHDMHFTSTSLIRESKYLEAQLDTPPSLFSQHNPNGFWDYSPLICGAGLVEGIIWAQRVAMEMWDDLVHPTLLMHLHNMLVKKKYLASRVELFRVLEDVHENDFFPSGKPTSNFHECLRRLMRRRNRLILASTRQQQSRTQMDAIHDDLDADSNVMFIPKSILKTYHDAQWVLNRIPDHALRPESMSYAMRTVESVNLTNGPLVENHDLVQLFKRRCGNEEFALALLSNFEACFLGESNADGLEGQIKEGQDYRKKPPVDPYDFTKSMLNKTQGYEQLDLIRYDIFNDVCGNLPISALNYLSVTATMVTLLGSVTDRLCNARHPLYVQFFEHAPPETQTARRVLLILAIMESEDTKGLELCAEAFKEHSTNTVRHAYWDGFQTDERGIVSFLHPDGDPNKCTAI